MKAKMKYSLALVLVFVAVYADAQGCSQCKLLAEQSTEVGEASFGTNINKGILFLMAIPYILLFILFRKRIIQFFRSRRSAKSI